MRSIPLLAACLSIALSAGAPAPAAHAQTVPLKLGHILPPDSPDHQAFLHLAQRASELTNGQVKIEVFPASQLGAVNVMLESLQTGSLDMMVELLEFFAGMDRRFGVFGVPYLFEGPGHLAKFVATPTFASWVKELGDSRGLVFYGNPGDWQFQSPRTLLARKAINTPADLKGVKMRMFQSRVPVMTWQMLGTNTVIIPWGETYAALATGTVDAVTARVEAHYQMKQTEVAKFLTVTEEYYQTYLPVMSKRTADKLSPAHREAITQATREAGARFQQLSAAATEEYKRRVRSEHGVTILEPPLAPWREAVAPLYARLEEENILPRGLIAEIRAAR